MTRYGFAIKALPQGGKPFGEEDDENEETVGTEEAPLDEVAPGVSDELTEDLDENLAQDPTATPAAPTDNLGENPAAPPDPGAQPEGEGGGDPSAALDQPDDDSRPWAGDEYNEGDETDPDGPEAWCAYTGSSGEQAWLDKAADGTLTGWVRDGAGQVWRYTDPDAWATDVDGAQMTQTHRNGEDRANAPGGAAPSGPPPAGDRGVQDSMFAGQ
ncbi:hypothetical protein SAMN05216483_6757 [Streptomyces sp. 2131.1]|uniref:hypothetical protein n=1 Tax=Streptomyces sp. 2131.1 TaxID=1855346 RepID=UPI00089C15B1|nr:hypothetical protein [Streptomyces sp. 2131.1]SEE84460.1 hypothetical protein SAMN05216483_6757 [Streptomyces sp. 2131.1]